MNASWSWASTWRCVECGLSEPIEPGQDTRPLREAHTCDPLTLRRAQRDGTQFAVVIDDETVDDGDTA